MILCNYRVFAVLLLLIRKYLASFQLPVGAFQLLLSQCLRVQFLVSLGPLKQPGNKFEIHSIVFVPLRGLMISFGDEKQGHQTHMAVLRFLMNMRGALRNKDRDAGKKLI